MFDVLEKMFVSRYSKRFADLNRNVYPAEAVEGGGFYAAVVRLSPGGGTVIPGDGSPFELKPGAVVSVDRKAMKSTGLVYRIYIPRSELEIASTKPEYFNYLMDAVVDSALSNFAATVGGPDKVRFGNHYCTYTRPEGNILSDYNDEFVELQLRGEWASSEEKQ